MESPIMTDVQLMVASGSKASRIYDYIRDKALYYMHLRDVYNLIAKIKNSGGTLSDDAQVAIMLMELDLQAPGTSRAWMKTHAVTLLLCLSVLLLQVFRLP
ncbi:hypothetical protein JG688_00012053 [Phytophthora aleatoria]|uniref:Uncharacterized protein n=1 Tax=Phytophthora aleatoria TaxID=2496075 RepID=A0A8J5IZJ8_9STRA|nr:hypothetical protein JG688_00012053 [Phytophthora aleatoria]